MGNFIISFLVVDEAHVKGLLPSFAVLQDEFVYHELLLMIEQLMIDRGPKLSGCSDFRVSAVGT